MVKDCRRFLALEDITTRTVQRAGGRLSSGARCRRAVTSITLNFFEILQKFVKVIKSKDTSRADVSSNLSGRRCARWEKEQRAAERFERLHDASC